MPGDNPSAEDIVLDGCTNLADTMPGGSTPQYNLGATAVHETGHVVHSCLLKSIVVLTLLIVAWTLPHIRGQ
jgi:hypothetical protein